MTPADQSPTMVPDNQAPNDRTHQSPQRHPDSRSHHGRDPGHLRPHLPCRRRVKTDPSATVLSRGQFPAVVDILHPSVLRWHE